MTPVSQINFTLEMDSVLTKRTMKFMKKCPRLVPIIEYGDKNRVVGVLNAQSCLGIDPDEKKTIRQLYAEREIEIKIPLYLP
jgi:CBS domain containing-hemolysin-like protein